MEEDTQGGKILLHGVRNNSKRRYLINMLDCMGLCCWKFGLNGGSLYDSYNVVSISIKKEVIIEFYEDIEKSLCYRNLAVTLP